MEHPELPFAFAPVKARKRRIPQEFKAVSIRPILLPEAMNQILNADAAVRYWRFAIETGPFFTNDRENCYAIALNSRCRAIGHYLIGMGTLNSICVHPREVFRVAILLNAHSIIMMHNHPSGDSEPSNEDIRTTRDLRRAGELLRIEVQDHIVVGCMLHISMREKGWFT